MAKNLAESSTGETTEGDVYGAAAKRADVEGSSRRRVEVMQGSSSELSSLGLLELKQGTEVSKTRRRVIMGSGFEEGVGGERRGDQEVVV